MTHEVRSRPMPPTTGSPTNAATAATAQRGVMDRVDQALEWLWHFLTSMRLAVVLILALAALGVAGSLIIQAPAGVLDDPQAKADWLAGVRPRYGGWTGIMDSLQLFQIFNSVVFRILVAALVISLVACSIHRIPGIWRTITKPRLDVGEAFFEHAPQHEAIVVRRTPADTLSVVSDVLRRRRYRTLAADDGTIHVYGDRFRWVLFSGLIAHLALVVILIGVIIGALYGYRDSSFAIAEGSTLPVGAEAGLSLQLIDFTDSYYATTGAPEDYASQVVLYKDGNEVARHTIRVNDPLRYGDVSFYQAFFGSAAVMTVTDASGNTLVSQGVPLAWRTTNGNRPIGSFNIPRTNYVGWVVGTLGSGDGQIQPGQVELELYTADSGDPVAQQVLDQGKAATVGDLTVTFDRESRFTGLSVSRDPGVMVVWLGGLLLFGGFALRFMLPHKRVWARISPRGTSGAVLAMASLGSREAALGTDFEKLVSDVRAALQAPARA
jgi:cytochrome c biogenesis protein